MQELKFYLIADTHFFKNSLGARGKEYDNFMRFEQKCFAETESINKAAFDYLVSEAKEADILLIAGDLSFNGEKESHREFIKLLEKVTESGKRVYVVSADHDCREHPFCFDENGKHEPEGTSLDDVYDLYYEYGFKDAIAVDRKHMSYVAQLSEGVRLLALCNDGDANGKHTFDDEHIAWIKEQTRKAREDGQMMFAMNHYPLLPGQPILSIVASSTQRDGDAVSTLLADEGVHLVFTGHMHNQSINMKLTPSGNRFFDVCTSSLIAYPSVIRLVTVKDEATVDIKTLKAPDFIWETGGRTCEKYLSDLFDGMILNILSDMENDPTRVLNKFGVKNQKKLFHLVKLLGRRLNRISVGGICRLLCVKCDDSIKGLPLRDYAAELIRGIFAGNQNFTAGTPKGDAFIAAMNRLEPVLKRVKLKNTAGEPVELKKILIESAGNYGYDDFDTTLELCTH